MKGSIISRQRCFICNRPLIHDEKRHGCYCIEHPQVAATNFIVRFPGGIYQNHKSYESASQSLNYLRHEKGNRKNKFNPDDYKSIKPNSFLVLKEKYLARKKDRATYKNVRPGFKNMQ